MPETTAPANAASRRDPRLDVFRGIALVMIFINHVPGTIFELATTRNFGFSDAAEGFVIMSGVAAGLAYSPALREGLHWSAVGRIWHRAWVLYLVHLLTTVLAIGVVAAGAMWLGTGRMLTLNNFEPIFSQPLSVQVGIPLLTHQIGYANILPMYAVMLIAAPFAIVAAPRWPLWLLAGSVALWALAGMRWINLPNFPNAGGWFFNPLSWQLIFTVGLLTGVAMRQGHRFLPVRTWAQWLAGAYLVLGLVCTQVPAASAMLGTMLWNIQEMGVHRLFTAFDKTYVTLPRLLHIFALAYLLSSLPAVRRAAGSAAAYPFALLGRHALPVFALGTVLAYVAQVVKEATPDSLALDSVILSIGLGLHMLMAWTKDRARLTRH